MAIFPLTMVPLELQRRIVDRAIGGENLGPLLRLGVIDLAVVLLQGGLKYLDTSIYRPLARGRRQEGSSGGSDRRV